MFYFETGVSQTVNNMDINTASFSKYKTSAVCGFWVGKKYFIFLKIHHHNYTKKYSTKCNVQAVPLRQPQTDW